MGRPVGWILDEASRSKLLERFPPKHDDVIAHHVTLWGRDFSKPLPPPVTFAVVGHSDDGRGIEALVVTVNGDTARPDGSVYHVTWSIDPASGLSAKHSNNLIAEAGWEPLEAPITFEAEPGAL